MHLSGARKPLLVLLAAWALASCGDDAERISGESIEGVVVEDGQTNDHVDAPAYEADPPSGGDHLPVWLDCGFYDVEVPNGNAVHALEHGVVWFAHDPDLPSGEVEVLRTLYDAEPERVVVSPYPDLPSPVVAVAWERRLEVDSAEDPRLSAFMDAFIDGDQSPEPGVRCSDGFVPGA